MSLLHRWAKNGVKVTTGAPLFLAANNEDTKIMTFLVKELGADVNKELSTRDTVCPHLSLWPLPRSIRIISVARQALFMAACMNKVKVVRCLVELGADVSQAMIKDGEFPLYIAAHEGMLETVRCLVEECGADVNQALGSGELRLGATSLHACAGNGHIAVVQYLVDELGADINAATSQNGTTPLMRAAMEGHVDVMRFIIQKMGTGFRQEEHVANGMTLLSMCAMGGHLSGVKYLVKELGADVNHKTDAGMTALHFSVMHGEVTKWLIKEGADPQAGPDADACGCGCGARTAEDMSRMHGVPIEQQDYLEAKTHCSNVGCSGAGKQKCQGCFQARYCGEVCQLAHWKAHKEGCKRVSALLKAGTGTKKAPPPLCECVGCFIKFDQRNGALKSKEHYLKLLEDSRKEEQESTCDEHEEELDEKYTKGKQIIEKLY
jgi:hypothetical protein